MCIASRQTAVAPVERDSGTFGRQQGCECRLGRVVSATFELGFEHYPLAREPQLVTSYYLQQSIVLVEGGGGKVQVSELLGLRIAFPGNRVEPFVEAGAGMVTLSRPYPRLVEPGTGAVVAPGGASHLSAAAAEFGAGLRTRRPAGCNWTLAVRWRRWSQIVEGDQGGSFQLRLGVVTH